MIGIAEHDDLIQYKGLEGTIKWYYVILCYFMYDSYNNCNENVEIAIKTLKDFRAG